jgi:hypothetical protein
MQKPKYKTNTAIAIFLIAIFAISIVPLQTTQALATRKTYCFLGVTPNPVGVNQEVLLHVGITLQLNSVAMGWEGLSVTVTKPDGTQETLSGIRTDATGGTGRIYLPTVTGNYTFQAHFPQQVTTATNYNAASAPANTTMLASDSPIMTLVVQDEPIPFNPGVPIPTDYWTRPINAQFREWYTISGSSWMSNDYNDAPDSPHILWTKPLTVGGLVGGDLGLVGSGATSVAFENGDAYEGKWQASIILAGYLYYQDAPGSLSGVGISGSPVKYHCVNLRTGEELWTKTFLDNRTLAFGQTFYWESYNYQGTYAYLWATVGTTWTAFDAFTGDWRATFTDMPSGTRVMGPRGEVYLYTVNLAQGWMALWNMSAFVSMAGSFGSSFMGREFNATSGNSRTMTNNGTLGVVSTSGAAARAARAWSWNITIPKGLQGSVRAINWTDGRVVGSNVNTTDVNIWAFSFPPIGLEGPMANPTPAGANGTLLYNADWKAPASWDQGNETISWVTTDLTVNVGVVWSKETYQHYAFDLTNGAYLWTTDPMGYLSTYSVNRRIFEGKFYSTGYQGVVYCYNLATGKIIWTYATRDPYQAEVLWGDNWPETMSFAQGGRIYLIHSEHSVNQPMPRGAPAVCLNASNGEVIWRVNGLFRKTDWGGGPIMGDSVIAMYDTYDQQVYAIGKGPSATSVLIRNDIATAGKTIVIQGTVNDASPGTKQTAVTLRFPNGVPAVSDDSQGDWMKYVYAQFPRPANATGVEVSIDAVDPNYNFVHLGTATSDSSGTFGFNWITPDIPGQYTIIASFAGSGGYYSSYAETYATVMAAPPTASPYPVTVLPPTETYFAISTIAIVIAVAIVGAMLALMLRKRP